MEKWYYKEKINKLLNCRMNLLKNDEELQLPYQVIECIKRDLNSYYDMNKQLNKVTTRAFAIGSSFERSASI